LDLSQNQNAFLTGGDVEAAISSTASSSTAIASASTASASNRAWTLSHLWTIMTIKTSSLRFTRAHY